MGLLVTLMVTVVIAFTCLSQDSNANPTNATAGINPKSPTNSTAPTFATPPINCTYLTYETAPLNQTALANSTDWSNVTILLPYAKTPISAIILGQELDSVELYSGATWDVCQLKQEQWGSCAEIPIDMAEVAAAYYDGRIYVVGGVYASPEKASDTYVYSIQNDTWEVLKDSQRPCVSDHHNGLVDGQFWWLFGGGSPCSDIIQRLDMETNLWEMIDLLPENLAAGSINAFKVEENNFLLCGGYPERCGHDSKKECAVYDASTGDFIETSGLRYNRNHAAYGEINDQFIIAGGRAKGNCDSPGSKKTQTLKKKHVFLDEPKSWWQKGPPLPFERNSQGNAPTCGGRLWAIGGESKTLPLGVNPKDYASIGYHYDPEWVKGSGKNNWIWSRVDAYNPETRLWDEVRPFLKTPRHGLFCVCAPAAGWEKQNREKKADRLYCLGGGNSAGVSFSNKCEYLDML